MKDEKNKEEILAWLKTFAQMVRSNDYSDAESLFDPTTFGFGTIAAQYSNLAEYNSLQWKDCWVGTRDFDFDYPSLRIESDQAGNFIVIGILWSSIGIRPSGEEFPRDGRATIVFKRNDKDSLVSVHNHYSRTPRNFPEDF